MRNESQKTTVGSTRGVVDAYRKQHGLSREAMALQIVEAHERIGAPARTGIEFDHQGDSFTVAKKHADRIWRWLDDETKDNNLLPANFIVSILAALPMDWRVELLNEILFGVDCAARGRETMQGGDINPIRIMQSILDANHRTESAAADLLDGIDPGELPRLHSSLISDISTKREQLGAVEAAMRTNKQHEVVTMRKVV